MPRSDPPAVPVSGELMGAQFLTWLWHAAQNGVEMALSGRPVRFAVADLLKLKAPDGSGAEVSVKGEFAAQAEEVYTALSRGALFYQAKFQVDVGGVVSVGTLKAAALALSAVKLPKNPEVTGEGPYTERGERPGEEARTPRADLEDETRLLDRMAMLDDAQAAVDQAFKDFLTLRASKGGYEAWVERLHADLAAASAAREGA